MSKLDKITNSLNKISEGVKGAERLELDSLNFLDQLADWMKFLEEWKRTVDSPVWSEELAEAKAAARVAAGQGRLPEEESAAEVENAEERECAIDME